MRSKKLGVAVPAITQRNFPLLGDDASFFRCTYLDSQKRQQPMYRLPKREATLMAMSYSHEISAQVDDKMQAVEKQLLARTALKLPQDYAEALMARLVLLRRIRASYGAV